MANVTLVELQETIVNLQQTLAENNNAFFLLSMALIIFFMQAGFAFLEAGSVRSKNTTNILIKNVLDCCIVAICYWAVGWGLAYGRPANMILGYGEFFMSGTTNFSLWFFQYVFAATAGTIVSGALAERCEFFAYLAYSALIATVVYPIVSHWTWDTTGWLKQGFETEHYGKISYVDFAGSGVVHICGGSIAFVGALILGARIGRFPCKSNNQPCEELKGHSVPFAALGGMILMMGFFAFNGGSQGSIASPGDGAAVARAMVSTVLSGSFAAMTALFIAKFITAKKWSLLLAINGCLAGMAAVCAGCNLYEPWACAVVGTGAGLIYMVISFLMVKIRIDDPLDAVAVHFGGGTWGVLIAPVMIQDGIVMSLIEGESPAKGLYMLLWNFVAAVSIALFSGISLGLLFLILKRANLFRVSAEVERKGLDIFKHGEAAYPLLAYGHGWEEIEEEVERKTSRFGANQEISLEELAQQYHRHSTNDFGMQSSQNGTKTAYENRGYYENPEQHRAMKSRITNGKNHADQPVKVDHCESISVTTRSYK